MILKRIVASVLGLTLVLAASDVLAKKGKKFFKDPRVKEVQLSIQHESKTDHTRFDIKEVESGKSYLWLMSWGEEGFQLDFGNAKVVKSHTGMFDQAKDMTPYIKAVSYKKNRTAWLSVWNSGNRGHIIKVFDPARTDNPVCEVISMGDPYAENFSMQWRAVKDKKGKSYFQIRYKNPGYKWRTCFTF